jgi:hypothetical protein
MNLANAGQQLGLVMDSLIVMISSMEQTYVVMTLMVAIALKNNVMAMILQMVVEQQAEQQAEQQVAALLIVMIVNLIGLHMALSAVIQHGLNMV